MLKNKQNESRLERKCSKGNRKLVSICWGRHEVDRRTLLWILGVYTVCLLLWQRWVRFIWLGSVQTETMGLDVDDVHAGDDGHHHLSLLLQVCTQIRIFDIVALAFEVWNKKKNSLNFRYVCCNKKKRNDEFQL